jgi:hypothetical protein
MAIGGGITVRTDGGGELKRALNESGWLKDEVLAAGHFRQGKAPSLAGMITGTALIEVLRPRRSKLLPRQFVLAATRGRVVAFKALGIGHGEPTEYYEVRIRPGEQASFPRAEASLTDLYEGRVADGGTLVIGAERIPVMRQAASGQDPNTDELVELLAR